MLHALACRYCTECQSSRRRHKCLCGGAGAGLHSPHRAADRPAQRRLALLKVTYRRLHPVVDSEADGRLGPLTKVRVSPLSAGRGPRATHTHTHTHRERESERARERQRQRERERGGYAATRADRVGAHAASPCVAKVGAISRMSSAACPARPARRTPSRGRPRRARPPSGGRTGPTRPRVPRPCLSRRRAEAH